MRHPPFSVAVAVLLCMRLLLLSWAPNVNGHAYLEFPISRNLYYTSAFQEEGFNELEDCPHCYEARGPENVRARAEEMTDPTELALYGEGRWPHYTSYKRRELASNGNYYEVDAIAVRHGICGDPSELAEEGSNKYGRETSLYPVIDAFMEGSVIDIKVVMSEHQWGHLEFFVCDVDDLPDGVDSPVTQRCLNMHPLSRAMDDGHRSPIDHRHRGRYHVEPPCVSRETNQTAVNAAHPGDVITAGYQLPHGFTCERCVLQMVYYTGNSCKHPGYDEFESPSWPSACAPNKDDWIALDLPVCGEGDAYPEEFWNCADIAIIPESSSTPRTSSESPSPGPSLSEWSAEPMETVTSPPGTWAPSTLLTDTPPGSGCTDEPVAAFGQCGGKYYEGSKCCPEGYECVALAECYSECQPVGGGCSEAWGQCGGMKWDGPTCCLEGSECKETNEWYSQCVPPEGA